MPHCASNKRSGKDSKSPRDQESSHQICLSIILVLTNWVVIISCIDSKKGKRKQKQKGTTSEESQYRYILKYKKRTKSRERGDKMATTKTGAIRPRRHHAGQRLDGHGFQIVCDPLPITTTVKIDANLST